MNNFDNTVNNIIEEQLINWSYNPNSQYAIADMNKFLQDVERAISILPVKGTTTKYQINKVPDKIKDNSNVEMVQGATDPADVRAQIYQAIYNCVFKNMQLRAQTLDFPVVLSVLQQRSIPVKDINEVFSLVRGRPSLNDNISEVPGRNTNISPQRPTLRPGQLPNSPNIVIPNTLKPKFRDRIKRHLKDLPQDVHNRLSRSQPTIR